jgi:hypothetical protein
MGDLYYELVLPADSPPADAGYLCIDPAAYVAQLHPESIDSQNHAAALPRKGDILTLCATAIGRSETQASVLYTHYAR